VAFHPDRTLSATNEIGQLAFDAVATEVPHLWVQAHPLYERWATGKKMGSGVRTKVWKTQTGGDTYRSRVNYARVSTVGRLNQATTITPTIVQRYSHANWPFYMNRGWIALGKQDELQIAGDPAKMFKYVQDETKVLTQSLAENRARAMYGYGYVHNAAQTVGALVIDWQGLALAVRRTNATMSTAADGYYGLIDRTDADAADWLAVEYTLTAPLQISDIQTALTSVTEGNDAPTIGICGSTVYNILWNFAEAKQRLINTADPNLGFAAPLSYSGIPILMDKTMDSSVFTDPTSATSLTGHFQEATGATTMWTSTSAFSRASTSSTRTTSTTLPSRVARARTVLR